MTTTTIFAGPSIYGSDPSSFTGFDMQPPAKCGDIVRAVLRGSVAIGLIDGTFENAASVWHKEILFALSHGVRVLGSSSMGALRAAECHQFGMVGIGGIFEEYKSGFRVSDADVAVLHGPAEFHFAPITQALVDIEATVARLAACALIEDSEMAKLMAAGRQLHFKKRTWLRLVDTAAIDTARRSFVLRGLETHHLSRKLQDARQLIDQLRQPTGSKPWGSFRWSFESTQLSAALETRIRRELRRDCRSER